MGGGGPLIPKSNRFLYLDISLSGLRARDGVDWGDKSLVLLSIHLQVKAFFITQHPSSTFVI